MGNFDIRPEWLMRCVVNAGARLFEWPSGIAGRPFQFACWPSDRGQRIDTHLAVVIPQAYGNPKNVSIVLTPEARQSLIAALAADEELHRLKEQ